MRDMLQEFIIAVRTDAQKDEGARGQTHRMRVRLILELESILADKKNRVAVLQAITGLPLASQNNLTFSFVSVLINESETNGQWRNIIEQIEKEATTPSLGKPWDLYPWHRPQTDLSNLQPEDQWQV